MDLFIALWLFCMFISGDYLIRLFLDCPFTVQEMGLWWWLLTFFFILCGPLSLITFIIVDWGLEDVT